MALRWTLTARDGIWTVAFAIRPVIPVGEPAKAVVKTLIDFQRMSIGKGASADVSFSVGPSDLTMHLVDGTETFFPGRYTIEAVLSAGHAESVELACTKDACTKV